MWNRVILLNLNRCFHDFYEVNNLFWKSSKYSLSFAHIDS